MAACFLDVEGIILVHYLSTDRTENGEYYYDLLHHAIRQGSSLNSSAAAEECGSEPLSKLSYS